MFHATFGVELDPLYTLDLPICSFENVRGAFFPPSSSPKRSERVHNTRCTQLRELISASVEFTAQEQSKKFARSPVSQLVFRVYSCFSWRITHATRRQSGEDDDNSGFTPHGVIFIARFLSRIFRIEGEGSGFKTVPTRFENRNSYRRLNVSWKFSSMDWKASRVTKFLLYFLSRSNVYSNFVQMFRKTVRDIFDPISKI